MYVCTTGRYIYKSHEIGYLFFDFLSILQSINHSRVICLSVQSICSYKESRELGICHP